MADFAEEDIENFIRKQTRAQSLDDKLNNSEMLEMSRFGYGNGKIGIGGSSMQNQDMKSIGGRFGANIPIDESSNLNVGISGHAAKGKGWNDIDIDQLDAEYQKKLKNGHKLKASLKGSKNGIDEAGVKYEIPFKKGGKVKVSKASKRADGCAQRGKTRGRMV